MASTDAKPVPQKNVAYRVTFPILDADGDLVTGAAGLDSQVSKDGGTFAACTNEATEIATSSGVYYLDLTSTEMNADTVAIIVKTSTSGAKTTTIVMYPEEAGDIRVNVTAFGGTAGTFSSGRPEVNTTHIAGSAVSTSTAQIGVNVVNFGGSAGTFASGRPEVNTTHAAGTAWGSGAITAASIASNAITSAKIATDAIGAAQIADGAIDAGAIASDAITAAKIADGAIDAATFATGAITAAAIAADAIGASELAADAVTEIQNGLATASALATVDSVVDAIKLVTDALPDSGALSSIATASALATVDTNVSAIQAVTDNLPDSGALTSIAQEASLITADDVWDEVFEGSLTSREGMRLFLAALCNLLSGAATTTISIRDLADSKDRIIATVDADGNRTAVTLDAS